MTGPRLVPPRSVRLGVALPVSTGLAEHGQLLRSYKWGIVARIAAVFRVNEIVVYSDRPGLSRLAREAKTLLEYLVVAPYLRRRVYPRLRELSYAGALPPLQLPTHGAGGPRVGECREALVLRKGSKEWLVDAGLGEPVPSPPLRGAARPPGPGERRIVCIESLSPPRLRPSRPGEIYTGYRVKLARDLVEAVDGWGFRLATSRLGEAATPQLLSRVAALAERRGSLLVLLGAPDAGLHEIARWQGLSLGELVDVVLNTVPLQGTLTVRVEEALAATLALLNLYTA